MLKKQSLSRMLCFALAIIMLLGVVVTIIVTTAFKPEATVADTDWIPYSDITDDTGLHYIVTYWHVTDVDGNVTGDTSEAEVFEDYLTSGSKSFETRIRKGEVFTGFVVAAGHSAVEITDADEDSIATVNYKEDVHVVKIHVFFRQAGVHLADDFTNLSGVNGMPVVLLKDEDDVFVNEDGELVYNTSTGLHTNKTAYAVGDTGTGTRTFDLTLESWYSDDVFVNVGMVLDASGSMAFLSSAGKFHKIRVEDKGTETGTINNIQWVPRSDVNKYLNPKLTDNSKLGYAGYSYYVYDGRTSTDEFVPLAYWDGTAIGTITYEGAAHYAAKDANGNTIAGLLDGASQMSYLASNRAGWYYLNSRNNIDQTRDNVISTAKSLRCGTRAVNNNRSLVYYCSEVGEASWATAPTLAENDVMSGWGDYQPCRFFIDDDGYLRVVFTASNSYYEYSYVYYKEDATRNKSEELQHALGIFVNDLSTRYPFAEIAATRFSLKPDALDGDYEWLIMLNWTSDPTDSINMMGFSRGEGTAWGYDRTSYEDDTRDNLNQYNYVLTGDTAVNEGLKSFYYDVSRNVLDEGERYLIVFTDGRDAAIDDTYLYDETFKTIENIRQDGYTVFTVLLNSGGTTIGGDIRDFLTDLAGDESRFKEAANSDGLQAAYAEILAEIIKEQEGYSIQDYIDPRFDVVDSRTNTVIHLNAGGTIEYKSGATNTTKQLSKTVGYSVNTVSDIDSAVRATLYYDNAVDMYYVVWDNQTIPTTMIGSTSLLDVWSSTLRVQAKDDFIGGNAVLSNGNGQNMNYVYHPDDVSGKSSGIADAQHMTTTVTGGVDYPSKGFPRTTVNVKVFDAAMTGNEQTLYLGETITPADVLKELVLTVNDDSYWSDYLLRYIKAYPNEYASQNAMFMAMVGTDDSVIEFELPYYYLPDTAGTNQTGTALHKGDRIGTLKYKWELVSGTDAKKSTAFVLSNTTDVVYRLTVTYEPYADGAERAANNAKLISETVYSTAKSAVGTSQTSRTANNTVTTHVVRGELAMEVKLDANDVLYLVDHDWAAKDSIMFRVNVSRTYSGNMGQFNIQPLTITVSRTELKSLAQQNRNGYVTIHSAVNSQQPLPIGTYVLTVDDSNSPFSFRSTFTYAGLGDYDNASGRFTSDVYQPSVTGETNYYAPTGSGVSFELGNRAGTKADGTYLRHRVGMVTMTGELSSNLTVSKIVSDDTGDVMNESFTFKVELYDRLNPSNLLLGTYRYETSSGRTGTMSSTNNMIALKHGESITIKDLPYGTPYKVTETEDDRFVVAPSNVVEGVLDGDKTLMFTNVYTPLVGLQIIPESNYHPITDDNDCYHFDGLRYEVYFGDQYITTVVSDRDGNIPFIGNLKPGTYTVYSINDNGCYGEAVNVGVVTIPVGEIGTVIMYHPPVWDTWFGIDKDWA